MFFLIWTNYCRNINLKIKVCAYKQNLRHIGSENRRETLLPCTYGTYLSSTSNPCVTRENYSCKQHVWHVYKSTNLLLLNFPEFVLHVTDYWDFDNLYFSNLSVPQEQYFFMYCTYIIPFCRTVIKDLSDPDLCCWNRKPPPVTPPSHSPLVYSSSKLVFSRKICYLGNVNSGAS